MKTESWILRIVALAALAAAIGAITFFTYTIVLRTDYKNTAIEINDAVLSFGGQTTIRQGNTQLDASAPIINYYDRFLLAPKTQAYSRKSIPENDHTISISLGPNRLSFTEGEDSWTTCILWETPEKQKSFCVRSQVTFIQLEAYFHNYEKRSTS